MMNIPGRFKTVFPQQPDLEVAIPQVERVSMKYISSSVSYVWIGEVVPSGVAFVSPSRVRMVIPSRCQINASPVARPGGGCFPAEYL